MCTEPEGYDHLHLSASHVLQTLRAASLQRRLTQGPVGSAAVPSPRSRPQDHHHQLNGAGEVECGHNLNGWAGDRAILILFATQNS